MTARIAALMAILTLGIVISGCVFNVTSYVDKDGAIIYVGEVQNDGKPLSSPIVTGTFYDAAGTVITTRTAPACRVMPTKSVAAFELWLPPGTARPARVEWKLSGDEVDDAFLADGLTGRLYGAGPGYPPAGTPSHFGEMTNTSPNNYLGGSGCVAWLNSGGEVVRVGEIQAAGLRFNAGSTLPFLVSEDVPADAVDAVFFLDAGVTPPGQDSFRVIDIPLSAYTHTSKVFGSGAPFYFGFGELHNSESSPISPAIIATTRDASGALNGLGDSKGLCNVPAPAGGFTYLGYGFRSAAPAGTPADVRVEATIADHAASLKSIQVSGVTKSAAGAPYLVTVRGKVKNTTAVTLSAVNVCAATYDSTGNVSSVFPGSATLGADGLAPGATATFSVEVPSFGTVASVNAVAAGRPKAP